MNDRKVIYLGIALACIFSVITGFGMYKYGSKKTVSNGIMVKQFGNSGENMGNTAVQASSKEETVSPSARITMIQHNKKCGHTTENEFSVPEDIINMTKKQLEKYYFGWKVDSFSSSDIIISKDNYGICDEHYIVKDVDGLVNVYNIDDDNNESLVYSTEIETKYLPKEDREKLNQGITIVGKENLSSLLEDYE